MSSFVSQTDAWIVAETLQRNAPAKRFACATRASATMGSRPRRTTLVLKGHVVALLTLVRANKVMPHHVIQLAERVRRAARLSWLAQRCQLPCSERRTTPHLERPLRQHCQREPGTEVATAGPPRRISPVQKMFQQGRKN